MSISSERTDLPDGSSILVMPYDEGLARKAVQNSLEDKTTPDPGADHTKSARQREPGPIRRFNDVFTDIGSTYLEALGMDGFEIAKAVQKRRDELFRNEFPLILPRFTLKCENCTAEYDQRVDECTYCGSEELREPNPAEKLDAQRFFENVNKEGQSLRDLMLLQEDDHGRIGVSTLIVRWEYVTASGDQTVLGKPLFEEGEIIRKEPKELVRGDPKRVVPVTDEDGRLGGWKWTCPLHREAALSDVPGGGCPECGAELQEVAFVEKKYVRSREPVKYYFNHEVLSWAYFYPRLHGLDGLSPVHHVWIKQAILHWMDIYAGAFFDPESDRYPNKFMVVHTTNADAWERNFEQAKDEAEENLYANKIFVNEYATDSQSTPELQVVELMDDQLLGQNQEIKKQYKSDIRTQFGVTDVFDSELEDAGGLNNEGLQLEVTDRSIASAQHDLTTGPLDELMKLMGYEDWYLAFVPPREKDLDELQQKVQIGNSAAQGGLDARMEDEELEIDDGEFEAQQGPMGGEEEGGEGLFASEDEDPLEEAQTKALEGFKHIVWEDAETKAEPFFADDEDVPEKAKEAIEKAIYQMGAIFEGVEKVASTELKDFFAEKLTQPQGWSITSLANDIAEKFDVDKDRARMIARTESASVLNNAREEMYEELTKEDEEPPKFKWVGPSDDRTSDACEWMKEQTNPKHGGEPVTMDELIELEKEAHDKFVGGRFRKHTIHPNERHTYVEAR